MKFVIIDDQTAMHLIMKRALSKITDVEVIGIFTDTNLAFSFINKNKVDIVFLDINMPGENGIIFGERLRESHSTIKIVFVTSHKEYALSAFNIYAFDYIVKPISEDRLRETIARACSENTENTYKRPEPDSSLALRSLIEPLTKREIEVVQLISSGMTNKEIAEHFSLSVGTVKNHTVNIFGKLQAKNRVHAISIAKELELFR